MAGRRLFACAQIPTNTLHQEREKPIFYQFIAYVHRAYSIPEHQTPVTLENSQELKVKYYL